MTPNRKTPPTSPYAITEEARIRNAEGEVIGIEIRLGCTTGPDGTTYREMVLRSDGHGTF